VRFAAASLSTVECPLPSVDSAYSAELTDGTLTKSAGTFGALKPGFRSLATLKFVVNVVGEL